MSKPKRNPSYYRLFRKPYCQRCGSKKFILHVHHKNHKRWDDRVSNLETLCEPCHVAHHKKPKETKEPKGLDLGWLANHYQVPGGIPEPPPKGILDYFM